MARTKQEVRNWLNARVGKQVADKSNYYLNGQCVALIKGLLEYLGAPNPYAARGNAKDVGNSYLREGIARKGDGWLRVVVNPNMGVVNGVRYGHVWVDLKNEANYEQNGARALYVTKNTRPYSQRVQVVNLDRYIKEDRKTNNQVANEIVNGKGGWGNNPQRTARLLAKGYNPVTIQNLVNKKMAAKNKPKAVYYTVKRGDSLSAIASRYKTTWKNLQKLNSIKNPNVIRVGQRIRVK